MQSLSVVIVCKNEERVIGHTLQSLHGLTDDIVVFDNGSTDNTIAIAQRNGAIVHKGNWDGFGKTKHKATGFAKYHWILSLDADEAIDDELKSELLKLDLQDERTVYELRFKNFMGDKWLRYGEWGGDKHVRLFNRKTVNWNEALVHENLVLPDSVKVKKLAGYVLHYTVNNYKEYAEKMVKYAMLNAEKYQLQGKQATWLHLRFSAGFTFLKYYIFKLGFLDGEAGYVCARMTAYYTFLKYARLRERNKKGVTR